VLVFMSFNINLFERLLVPLGEIFCVRLKLTAWASLNSLQQRQPQNFSKPVTKVAYLD